MIRIISAFAILALLGGCVSTRPLGEMALDSNRLVADTANEQMLLNILRAKDRMPMHFTSFKVVNGDLSLSASAELGLHLPGESLSRSFDGDGMLTARELGEGVRSAAPSIRGAIETSPGFELAIYDNQEFQRGVLMPVRESVIEYYLQSGWKQDFLTALLVGRVEVTFRDGAGEVVGRFALSNDPDQRGRFGTVVSAIEMVPQARPGSTTALIPLADFAGNLSLADLERLDGGRFDIERFTEEDCETRGIANCRPDTFVVRRAPGSRGIAFRSVEDAAARERMVQLLPPEAAALLEGGACAEASGPIEGQARLVCAAEGGGGTVEYDFLLRAPEGILYFLGSYVRCDLDPECEVYRLSDGTKVIEVVEGRPAGAPITTRHLGRTYSLTAPARAAEDPTHRGTQAIVLVQQLINLQKSADSLPVSSSIRLRN